MQIMSGASLSEMVEVDDNMSCFLDSSVLIVFYAYNVNLLGMCCTQSMHTVDIGSQLDDCV